MVLEWAEFNATMEQRILYFSVEFRSVAQNPPFPPVDKANSIGKRCCMSNVPDIYLEKRYAEFGIVQLEPSALRKFLDMFEGETAMLTINECCIYEFFNCFNNTEGPVIIH